MVTKITGGLNSLFLDFFNNKRVLVTGHTGFKGSWLSVWLQKLGAEVIGYGRDPLTVNDNYVISNIEKNIIDIRGDIKDFEKLQKVFKEYKPDVVFHLAAQSLVRRSFEIPRETLEDNIMGTVNILDCIKITESVKSAVLITSDKCYENKETIWGYRENDGLGGKDPYSASKGASEIVIQSYINSFFKQMNKGVASARAGNVIGGGDWSENRLVPDFFRAVQQGAPIEIRNPHHIRPWQHVLEPLSGYLWLAVKLAQETSKYSMGWNFGPTAESVITVQNIIKKLVSLVPNSSFSILHMDSMEASLLNLDCTKAYFELRWTPTLDIDTCLHLTADWYKKFRQNDGHKLCLEQLNYYEEMAKKKEQVWAL